MRSLLIAVIAFAGIAVASEASARVIVTYHNGHWDYTIVPDRAPTYCPHHVNPYYPTYYPSPYVHPYTPQNVPHYYYHHRKPTRHHHHRNHGCR